MVVPLSESIRSDICNDALIFWIVPETESDLNHG